MLTPFRHDDFLHKNEQVSYGFYGRVGGQSCGVFSGLNCGLGSGDQECDVLANRQKVAEDLNVRSYRDIFSPYQIHGAECAVIKDGDDLSSRPQADACVTDCAGVVLSVVTADCAPVLFYANIPYGGTVIGAAHAGWKGAFGGVLDKVVQTMVCDYGAQPSDIRACVGPCIAQKSYEVDAGFYDRFYKCTPEYDAFFINGVTEDKYQFDLEGFCIHRLKSAGLVHVYGLAQDTYVQDDLFFSYRRSVHRGEHDYGRQISAIVLR